MTPADLLAFLSTRGGQEFEVTALLRVGHGRRATVRELGTYRLVARGENIRASGPSGQARHLTPGLFTEVFGRHEFTAPRPTGVLTDLGPLFAPNDEAGASAPTPVV